jgi:hypothetical protein
VSTQDTANDTVDDTGHLADLLPVTDRWAAVPDPADAVAVQNLVQAYAVYADAGRTEAVAGLFTEDAVWDGTALNYGTAEGAEAIGVIVTGHFRPDEPMMHLPGPPIVTVAGADEIHSVCWCLATRWTAGTTGPLIRFYYEDVVRRAADGRWLFARRRLRPAFPSPA